MNCDALENATKVSPLLQVIEAVREVPRGACASLVSGSCSDENKVIASRSMLRPPSNFYNGLAFRWLKQVEGWNKGLGYGSSMRILSALYGAVAPITFVAVSLRYVETIGCGWEELATESEWVELFEEGRNGELCQ